MKFCDADACPDCALTEGTSSCLRQKARFCRWLAASAASRPLKLALEKMSSDLVEEANALDREQILKAAG